MSYCNTRIGFTNIVQLSMENTENNVIEVSEDDEDSYETSLEIPETPNPFQVLTRIKFNF